jgi:hypothetical protein
MSQAIGENLFLISFFLIYQVLDDIATVNLKKNGCLITANTYFWKHAAHKLQMGDEAMRCG